MQTTKRARPETLPEPAADAMLTTLKYVYTGSKNHVYYLVRIIAMRIIPLMTRIVTRSIRGFETVQEYAGLAATLGTFLDFRASSVDLAMQSIWLSFADMHCEE